MNARGDAPGSLDPRGTPCATILARFEATVAAWPDAIALEIPSAPGRARVRWTYRELDRAADAVAQLVDAARGDAAHAPDTVVALALPRTDPRLFAAMLGVMRAGSAYTAIDPSFPARQAARIVRDADARLLVADAARGAEIGSELAADAAPSILTPEEIDAAPTTAQPSARRPIDPASLAYLIYTSGTTGRPKGVEITHASIANLVEGDIAAFGLGPTDRAVQGSSASYDSSVEEMWLAWAVGATALVMDDATARLGPDLLPWLQAERVTVLCPPPTLLRTLGCDDPQAALPALRFLYVGGEALPEDLAAAWSRGRRLENGYGPTECTVTCLRATVRAGEPVTIGRAIPGSFAAVVDPDSPVLAEIDTPRHGAPALGELVVGGASLARGYRGQPETTAARFVEHPTLGRVYRTGDLVHRDARGEFHYHGRIDAQVKLRGYRIELGAVEAALAAHPSVLEAAATVEEGTADHASGSAGTQRRLVAHVVARAGSQVDPEALRAFVGESLPPYMVPSAIAAIDALPRSVGGKLDRRRLPVIARGAGADDARSANFAPAATDTERALAQAIAEALKRPESADSIGIDDDFFTDLGLDSLSVAIAVSRLRVRPATRAATVRLAYEHRTIRAAAAVLDAQRAASDEPRPAPREASPAPLGTARPAAFTLAQTVFLAVLLATGVQFLWLPGLGDFVETRIAESGWARLAGLVAIAGLASAIVGAYAVVTFSVGVAAKWLLIGRYRAGRHRAFSSWHLRHWMVVRIVSMAPWEVFETLGLAPLALRLLGSRIGRRVHIHRGVRLTDGGWDLITLEDDATIGQDACLRAVELESGTLRVGAVTVRRGGTLETRAGLSPGAELGEGSILRALSNLVAGPREDRAVLDGVPARRVAEAPAVPSVPPPPGVAIRAAAAFSLFAITVAALAMPWLALFRATGLDQRPHDILFPPGSVLPSWRGLALLLVATVCAAIATVLVQALLVRMLGQPPRGAYSLRSIASLRISMQSALVEGAGKWLSGTLMWPMWLNLAGARIGRGCEISTVTDVVPATVSIGRETFFADGIYLGGPRLHAGTATLEPVELAESCFVGNHAVLPSGTRLARETLVGISTRGDGLPDEPGASWFGHPSFRLPKREVVAMPRKLTHDPPFVRRINRWAWEVARFALPIGPILAGLAWFRIMELLAADLTPTVFRLVALPLGVLASMAALAAAVLAMKWTLVGRVRPGTHALWSCWCSRWDFLYVAWGMWASVPLAFLEGTLLLVAYLRLMGCRIGRRALLGSGFAHVVDPDMLHFGDGVTVQALFQAHTFEDRVLKIDHVRIDDGASVGANTVLLYGAEIGAGARVEPHSVVMKRELLLPATRYEGVPTQAVGALGAEQG